MYTEKLFQKLKQYIEITSSPLLIKLLINGLQVDITYQKRQLQKITMMDQDHCEVDVTQVVRASMDVPDKIPFSGLVKVRATVIHTFSDFEKKNAKGEYLDHKDLTKKIILQQMDGAQNKLRVIVSSIVDINGLDSGSFHTELESLEFLMKQGFNVVYHEQLVNTYKDMLRYYKTFHEYHRKEIGYSISGLQILAANTLGCKEEFILPFSPDEVILTVYDIYPEVNPTGKIEPAIKIKANDMAGERYFTLRLPNFSMIKSLDIRIGDHVLMEDVHTIIGVEKGKRTGSEICVVQPEICPNCGSKLEINDEHSYCINRECRNKPISNQEVRKHGLEGKTVVITGTLSIRRYEFRKLIEQAGGTLAGVVTNQTDFLLIGAKGVGTVKYRKAESLKIPIITEEQFRLMID